ncbi:Intermembrane lipid transfer protein [Dirofilaria immitis]
MEKAHIKVQKCKYKNSKKKPVSVLKNRLSAELHQEICLCHPLLVIIKFTAVWKSHQFSIHIEMRNKDMENFRNQLVKPKKQEHLNSGTKYPHIDLVNDLPKMEMLDLMDAELDLLILNGFDKEVVKSDESNNDKVERDLWMLHC